MKTVSLFGAIACLCLACPSIHAQEMSGLPVPENETISANAASLYLTDVKVRYVYDTDGYKGYAAFIYDQNREIIPTKYDQNYEISWYTFSQGFSYPNFINMDFFTEGRTNPLDPAILTAIECNSAATSAPAPRWGALADDGRCWCGVRFPASFKGTLVCVVKQLNTGRAYKFTTPVSISTYTVTPTPAGSVITIEKVKDPDATVYSVPEAVQCNLYNESGIVRSISGDAGSSVQMDVSDLLEGNYYLEIVENGERVHRQVVLIAR